MSVFKKILDGLSGGLVGTIGDIIDKTSTSDEERLKLRNEIEKAIMHHSEAINEQMLNYEAQITERHKHDMASDSSLSKNVRPLVLIFLTVSVVVLAYATIFTLATDKVVLLNPWIELLTTLLLAAYGFYFGGRTVEKFKHIAKASK